MELSAPLGHIQRGRARAGELANALSGYSEKKGRAVKLKLKHYDQTDNLERGIFLSPSREEILKHDDTTIIPSKLDSKSSSSMNEQKESMSFNHFLPYRSENFVEALLNSMGLNRRTQLL